MNRRIIVDAHQDLAYNAISIGRDFLQSANAARQREIPPDPEQGTATLGLPEVLAGNVRIIFATIFCKPCASGGLSSGPCYDTANEAYLQAQEQLAFYATLAMDPRISLITTRDDLERVLAQESPHVGLVLLMEGADPMVVPQQAAEWFESGVRMVGPAWSGTRYSGGTRAPGPLTPLGRELMGEMERAGLVLDVSHMAEKSFFDALELFHGPVIASHSNCRAYVPTDRQLSDDMIRAVVQRDGVIGAVLFNGFIQEGWREAGARKEAVTLADLVRHTQRVCDIAGDALHAGIGSDLDGGFGEEGIPLELKTAADLPRIGDALAAAHFSDTDIDNILGGNWVRLLRRTLPSG